MKSLLPESDRILLGPGPRHDHFAPGHDPVCRASRFDGEGQIRMPHVMLENV